ncbi:poly(ADP-ribose) polymerase pme-5-like [Elysia marginata]|uniref:Poly(ADP-ribose) polymerase pme-5-like n=1 Tax=Elysia marginata TaxID=1093978 RepID=A0AAV4EMR5_9GAST|nr:poly(ADP-ribose) polymerase pme-5-like [Elysia marginata]
MPGTRENSLASKMRRQASATNKEPAEIASLRRQPTEEIVASSNRRPDTTSRRDRTLNGQTSPRKSQRAQAAHSVRQATLKLSSCASSKVLSPSAETKNASKQARRATLNGPSQPLKTLSLSAAKQTRRMTPKHNSLPAPNKLLCNGSVTTSELKAQIVSGDSNAKGLSRTSPERAKPSTQISKSSANTKQLWFPGKAFLAVRAPDDEQYYLCRTRNRVYNTTRQVPITWLSLRNKRNQVLGKSHIAPIEYIISFKDVVDPTAILMEVSLDRVSRLVYSLPRDQQREIGRLVKLAQAVEQGDLSINNIGDDGERKQHFGIYITALLDH